MRDRLSHTNMKLIHPNDFDMMLRFPITSLDFSRTIKYFAALTYESLFLIIVRMLNCFCGAHFSGDQNIGTICSF